MKRAAHARYGLLFSLSLTLSWTLISALIAMSFWSGAHTFEAAAQWMGLWMFTVAAPTVQAVWLHRRLNEVLMVCPTLNSRVRRDLMHVRFALLMFGSMTVLVVIGLRVAP